MDKVSLVTEFQKARLHLANKDPVLKTLIRCVGPCTLSVMPNHFPLLVRAIVSQQISTRAAMAISARLLALLEPDSLSPKAILKCTDDELRSVGLSAAKTRYLRDLA